VPVIAAVSSGLGEYTYPQSAITEAFGRVVLGPARGNDPAAMALLKRVHESTGVVQRHLVMPLEQYEQVDGFGATNDIFIESGTRLASGAVVEALDKAGLRPSDVDLIVSTTVTGVAAPSIDARLVATVGLRNDVKRVPMFGLGCVAGAAGVARVADYLRGHPDHIAVLVSVELCSLTVQRDDASLANVVASGLFGDGVAAVVMVGDRHAEELGLVGPVVEASRSVFYPDTERLMGWDIGGSGFRIVLAPTVADVIGANIGGNVKEFLGEHDLDLADVTHWVAHPGGPKVLLAMQEALGLTGSELDVTWKSLTSVGNLSSASVLHVLHDTLLQSRPGSGLPAMMLAMGPGFCAELVLMSW
jgi:alkylresorcinol/alkylpyrone synthase